MIIPQCFTCKHLNGYWKCAAFAEIAPEILQNRLDHREPIEGDHGIRYESIDPEAKREAADQYAVLRDAPLATKRVVRSRYGDAATRSPTAFLARVTADLDHGHEVHAEILALLHKMKS